MGSKGTSFFSSACAAWVCKKKKKRFGLELEIFTRDPQAIERVSGASAFTAKTMFQRTRNVHHQGGMEEYCLGTASVTGASSRGFR